MARKKSGNGGREGPPKGRGAQKAPGEVGYRRPPKHTQFKKGQSGNPGGGKKKPEPYLDRAEKIIRQKLRGVGKDNKKISIESDVAMIRAQVKKAVQGDTKAFSALQPIIALIEARQAERRRAQELTPEEQKEIERFAAQLRRLEEDDDE